MAIIKSMHADIFVICKVIRSNKNFNRLTNMDLNLMELLNGKEDWVFLIEIALRTVVMYLIILCALTILGKRGVKQLSVFELVIIIGLGSAAGDPMFYKDVGLLNGITVFTVVILMYKLTTYVVFKSDRIERVIEGKALYLIQNGQFSLQNFTKEPLAYDEFFAEMRQQGVSHLGQVDLAIIEITGEISLYFYEDKDVKYGLPVIPHLFAEKQRQILKKGIYSCCWCGQTETLDVADIHLCQVCGKDLWVTSLNSRRVV